MNRAIFALLAACGGATQNASTAASSPASTSAEATPASAPVGEMKAVTPTAYADQLRVIGLEPGKLPPLNKLAPEQLRKVMPFIARSLGVKCNACHDMNGEMSTMTPRMKVAEHMWNEFVRIRTISNDQPVFCDSCHHQSLTFLDRQDRPALEHWMDENFVKTLDAGSCKTCHGDPPRWKFIDVWRGNPQVLR